MLQNHHIRKLQQTIYRQHTTQRILHIATCVADRRELCWGSVEDAFGHAAGVGAGDYGDAGEGWVGCDDGEELGEEGGEGVGGVVEVCGGVAGEEGLDGGGDHGGGGELGGGAGDSGGGGFWRLRRLLE